MRPLPAILAPGLHVDTICMRPNFCSIRERRFWAGAVRQERDVPDERASASSTMQEPAVRIATAITADRIRFVILYSRVCRGVAPTLVWLDRTSRQSAAMGYGSAPRAP